MTLKNKPDGRKRNGGSRPGSGPKKGDPTTTIAVRMPIKIIDAAKAKTPDLKQNIKDLITRISIEGSPCTNTKGTPD